MDKLKNKFYYIVFFLLYTFLSCRFTPLGGGDLVVSSSITESKEKGMFKREYKLISDSIFEYKDSIINIKLVFNDIFVENTHKEIRRVPAYKEKKYYNSGCDTCPEQFVAHFKADSIALANYFDYTYIYGNKAGMRTCIFTYFAYEKFIPDTVILYLKSSVEYEKEANLTQEVCFGTLTFVKK